MPQRKLQMVPEVSLEVKLGMSLGIILKSLANLNEVPTSSNMNKATISRETKR